VAKEPQYKIKKEWVEHALATSIWGTGNDWLYDLCERYPSHNKIDHVLAKIWLIGRAYAASAERGVSGKGKGDEYLIQLSKRLIDNKIDKFLSGLPKGTANYSSYYQSVVKAHRDVELVFADKNKLKRVSLTSKYLHFHRPNLFPIYDSRVAQAITKVTPDYRHTKYPLPKEYEKSVYGKHCARYVWLLQKVTALNGEAITLRQLDNLLLEVYRKLCKK
jgi:hypothetical protein